MYTNFYQDQEMKYTEIAIVLEEFESDKIGKFYIPVLLPEIPGGNPINKTGRVSSSNIVNPSGKAGIGSYTSTNYVELRVPGYIREEIETPKYISEHHSIMVIRKGVKVLVTFIGGEANKPCIIGIPM